ncbi:MAG: HU family DNA-binding protein [Chlamydiae bacterium]|nr:HU family DNA-binding protein [Chlamydiota bacterium]
MNKTELVQELSDATGFTKADSYKFITAFTNVISGSLKKGKEISIVGFGSYKVNKRKARTGRNPQTGDAIKIPAKKVPTFRPGKALKDACN